MSPAAARWRARTAWLSSKAAGDQSNPSAAWNGNKFLVIWADARNGNDLDIYGSLANSAGTTLNSSGIGISTRFGVSEGSPALSAIGTQFLVGWSDTHGGTQDIYSSRVSDAGSVLSPNGVKVNSAAQDQTTPAVGVNGNSFLVVWGDTRSGTNSDIYGTRVSTSVAVQDTPTGSPSPPERGAGDGGRCRWRHRPPQFRREPEQRGGAFSAPPPLRSPDRLSRCGTRFS